MTALTLGTLLSCWSWRNSTFVDAMLPQGHRLRVAFDGIGREVAAINPQVRAQGRPARRPRPARVDAGRRRPLPGGRGARRPEHRGRPVSYTHLTLPTIYS